MATSDNAFGGLVPLGKVPNAAGNLLRRVLGMAIEGYGALPPAKESAANQLRKHQDAEAAIDSLINLHVTMAGAQGFVTNIGGVLTTLVAMPANIAGVAVLQARLVATIAHLRGYDIDDPRVRTAVAMCLVGDDLEKSLGEAGLPSSPLVVATAPVFDSGLDQKISDRVAADLLARITGKRVVVAMTKRVPVLGGGVGAAFDGWDTLTVARYAKSQLVDRRRRS
ncbi:MAG: EcsC family protein [Propionibacteriaceae bacterium]|nr:EcsC family protein [Propionibacteriaceae bacterium]